VVVEGGWKVDGRDWKVFVEKGENQRRPRPRCDRFCDTASQKSHSTYPPRLRVRGTAIAVLRAQRPSPVGACAAAAFVFTSVLRATI
jgi:hypothetical protein